MPAKSALDLVFLSGDERGFLPCTQIKAKLTLIEFATLHRENLQLLAMHVAINCVVLLRSGLLHKDDNREVSVWVSRDSGRAPNQ